MQIGGYTLDADGVEALRTLIRAELGRILPQSTQRRRRHEQSASAGGGGAVCVEIVSGSGVDYVCKVYGNGYYAADGSVNSVTATGQTLKIWRLNAAAVIQAGDTIWAQQKNGRYEGPYEGRWR